MVLKVAMNMAISGVCPHNQAETGEDVMAIKAETLKAVQVFSDLDIKDREQLAGWMTEKTYSSDQPIITQEDNSKDVYFLINGHVRATMYATSGKEVSYQDLGPGEMFGELAAIDGGPRTTYVVALCDTRVARMNSERFWEVLQGHPSVAQSTFLRLTSLIRMHCERIFEYSTLGVKNRIHAELLRLARELSEDASSVEIEGAPTHAEIASRVATHREAVTRACKQLELQGIIEWSPGRHIIKDVPTLERMVKEVRGH